MTRKLMLASAIAAALTGHPALALELGALRTESALNQPFQGEIDLGDIGPGELDTLRISIASTEEFKKAGIERYYSLTQLRFTPEVTADGRMLVRVSSREPVREPYLDFLVKAEWPTGRLIKGYTVLLDPPAQTERRAPSVQSARATTATSGPARGLPPVASDAGAYIPAPGEGFPLYIGPIGGGEGLWSLARRHATAGATDAQTAMALYRCNQGAFVRGNINRLIAGKTLVIPSRAELFALDAAEARRELQAALQGRSAQRAPLTDVTPDMLSRLRLVGATPGTTATPMPSTTAPAAGTGGTPSSDVLLAIETSESARQETMELRNRVKELEAQLADIQSLLQLRNAELARAQSAESQIPDVATVPDRSEAEVEPEARPEPEPTPEAGPIGATPDALAQDTTDVIEPAPAETPSAIEIEPEPEAPSGLIPVPTPMPVEPETSIEVAPEPPAPQAAPESTPVAAPKPPEPVPVPESDSTWHSLLLPLAGLAGVTALGILLFSLLTARRRRQEQAGAESDLESDLVLEQPDRPSASTPGSAPLTAEQSEALSLNKVEPVRQPAAAPDSTPRVPDLDDTNEPTMSGLTDFDAETDEADVLSEADIYIAYGRHREARDLLNKELKRYPQRLDIKYKLAEALAASGEIEALRDLLDEIRAFGGDTQEPAQWERMQHALRELAPHAPLAPATPSLTPSAVAAARAGLGLSAKVSETLETVAVPALESVIAAEPESEDDLLLDLDDSGPLDFADLGSKPSDESLKLELDDSAPEVPAVEEITQAIEADIDSILPLPDESEGLDLDLDVISERPGPIDQPSTAADELALDLDLDVPPAENLGDLDLMIDGLGSEVEPLESPILLDEPSDKTEDSRMAEDSGLSPEQESVPTDLLSSQWQVDSGIWDETATKLDLARAYVEMDDKEAAREILEEVIAEGRDEQRNEARAMLERLG